LEVSKDGVEWDPDVSGREVDEKLRGIFAWGVPPPGGRGGVKGLPQTFIRQVLLPEQTDVDNILKQSLENDPDDSGKVRLIKALQALAHDPRVKKVLDQAQAEVDRYFTATGQKKRGQASPFKSVADELKLLNEELESMGQELRDAEVVESQVRDLRDRLTQLEEVKREAETQVRRVQDRLAKSKEREQAQEKLDRAREELRKIDELRRQVQERKNALVLKNAEVEELERDLAGERTKLDRARSAVETAKEAYHRATSNEAAVERKLQREQLEKEGLKLDQKRLATEDRRARAENTRQLAERLRERQKEKANLHEQTAEAQRRIETSKIALDKVEQMRKRLADIQAYARWDRARKTFEDAESADKEAKKTQTSMRSLEREIEVELSAQSERKMPDCDVVNRLMNLDQQLRIAEAALGGAFSVTVQPRRALSIQAHVDEKKKRSVTGESMVRFDAERSLDLVIEDLVDVQILAGAAEKRQQYESLRVAWAREAKPVLAAVGVSSVSELAGARSIADDAARDIQAKRDQAVQLRERYMELSQRAQNLPALKKELDAWTVELEGRDMTGAKVCLETLGSTWESQVSSTSDQLEEERARASNACRTAQSDAARLEGELSQVQIREVSAREQAEAAAKALGANADEALVCVIEDLVVIDAQIQKLNQAMTALDRDGSGIQREAKVPVQAAEKKVGEAEAAMKKAEERLQVARSERDIAEGELRRLGTEVAAQPRSTLEANVAELEKALATLAVPDEPANEQDLAQALEHAQRAGTDMQQADRALAQGQGSLLGVRGAVVRERHDEARRALERAKEHQRELELEADSWRLLRDTLQEAEANTVQHVGRALAGSVGPRFSALTNGRYGSITIDPMLRTEGVEAAGAVRSTDVLSEGTKDQLATLLRLSIAESLKSAIVLDDHLVQTDPTRLEWLLQALQETAKTIQIVVLTCRPLDYVLRSSSSSEGEGSGTNVVAVKVTDLEPVLRRRGTKPTSSAGRQSTIVS